MSYFEMLLWFVLISAACALLTGAVAVLIAMLVEIAEEDTRKFKAWVKSRRWRNLWA